MITMKTERGGREFLLFSSVWSSLMKHDKRAFELATQMCIPVEQILFCLFYSDFIFIPHTTFSTLKS